MRNFLFLTLAALCFIGARACSADEPQAVPGIQVLMKAELPAAVGSMRGEDKLDESQTQTVDYWLFIPSNDAAKTDDGYPLLLFLHGAGERGDNPEAVKSYGPAKFCADPEMAKRWRFITVSPQCKKDRFWSPKQLMALVDKVCAEQPVDRSRIYVTGVSMGGFGTWGVASLASKKLAAVIPICGGFSEEKASTITVPVWAFHGDADPVVSVKGGYSIVNAVKAAGNDDVIFTVYPGVNHDSWTITYANPLIYDWLLSKKSKPSIVGQELVPGKQSLLKASVPVKVGNPFFGKDEVDTSRDEEMNFWAFQPTNDSAKTDDGYPLLLFLHGGGEGGNNPQVVKKHGVPKVLDNPSRAADWKFFTISPQSREGGWSAKQLMVLIDRVCEKFPIDRNRIYVTGMSMGGVGTWGCAAIGEGKLAAVAPLCGHAAPKEDAGKAKMPIWAFHGEADPVVKLELGEEAVEFAKNGGNTEVKFTTYPGVGHDCWTITYDREDLYEWFLSKSLKK